MEAAKKITDSSSELWKIANGEVVIVNGEIQNNPFACHSRSSKTVQWMIQNEPKVMGRLESLLRAKPIQGGDSMDCFDFSLDYFTNRDSRVFKKNFHGAGTTYCIEQYVLSNLKNVVNAYRSKLEPKKVKITPLINREEALGYMGKVEDKISAKDRYDEPEDALLMSDIEYWDNQFADIMEWFNWFVDSKKYVKFHTEAFIYYMFLYNRYEDAETQLASTAQICKMGTGLSNLVLTDIRRSVKTGESGSRAFLSGVSGLIPAVKSGWVPLCIRKGEIPNVR